MKGAGLKKWQEKYKTIEKELDRAIHDEEKQRVFHKMCKDKKPVLNYLYKNGFFVFKQKEDDIESLLERKKNLKTRYETLKIYRLPSKWNIFRSFRTWLPRCKRLIINLVFCKDKLKALNTLSLITNYYGKLGDIYMYSPCNGLGYRYYSGEATIIYIVKENLKVKQLHDIRKAIYSETANGYNINDCYKVIVSLNKNALKEFDNDWIVSCIDDSYQLYSQLIHAWKGNSYNSVDIKNYCRIRDFDPLSSDL